MEEFYMINLLGKRSEVFIESTSEYDEADIFFNEPGCIIPTEFTISEGKVFYDLIRFQDVSNIAISERLYATLLENQVTGWKAYKINIKGIKHQYYGLQVTGKCGKLIEHKECGFYTGVKFEYSYWDKSDIFSPEGARYIFCTQNVREIILNGKCTNIELRELTTKELYSLGED